MKIVAKYSTSAQLRQPEEQMLAGLFPRCDLTNAPHTETRTNVLTPYGDDFFGEAPMRAWPY
jgi:hypothetical protein